MTSKKDSFYSGADKCDFACLVLAAVKYTAESTSNVPNKTGTLCAKWNFCGLVSIFLVNNQKRDAGTEPSLQEGSFTFVRGWFDILKFVKSSNAL